MSNVRPLKRSKPKEPLVVQKQAEYLLDDDRATFVAAYAQLMKWQNIVNLIVKPYALPQGAQITEHGEIVRPQVVEAPPVEEPDEAI